MPEDHNPLDGLDQPRPLSGAQRDRLEQALLADDLAARLAEAAAPRPLPTALRASLLAQLACRPRWRDPSALGGAAAAVAVVAVAVLLAGPGEGPAGTSTALPPSPAVTDSGVGTSGGVTDPGPVFGSGVRATPTPGDFARPSSTASRAAADGSGTVQPRAAGAPVAGSPTPAPVAAAGPLVRSLTPATGPLTGGNVVVVLGERLAPDPEVWFGTVRASSVEVRSDGELRVVAPAHLPGEVEVVVRTSLGSSAPGPATRYRYAA